GSQAPRDVDHKPLYGLVDAAERVCAVQAVGHAVSLVRHERLAAKVAPVPVEAIRQRHDPMELFACIELAVSVWVAEYKNVLFPSDRGVAVLVSCAKADGLSAVDGQPTGMIKGAKQVADSGCLLVALDQRAETGYCDTQQNAQHRNGH